MSAVTFQIPANLVHFASISLNPVSMSQTSRSSFVPGFRTRGVLSSYWTAEVTFGAMNGVDATNWRELQAFIARLEGQRNRVSLYDPSRPRPLGAGFGSATTYSWEYDSTTYAWEYDGATYLWQSGLVNSVKMSVAADRGAERITLGGLTASTTKAIRRGDMFGIGGNLHMAMTEANTNSIGVATVSIFPRLRKPAAINSNVQVDKPRGRFSLASSEAFDMSVEPGNIMRGATLSLVEVPDIGVVY